MPPMWSHFKARLGSKLARHMRISLFKMRNTTPMVSFTFDDVPISAAKRGAEMLEEYNARGTYYVAGGLVDSWSGNWATVSADDIVALYRKGHEIACHTFSHARATDLSEAAMAEELDRNRRYLLALDPSIRIENFAYPYGTGSIWRKAQLGKTFRSSRGILPGVNSGAIDLQYLRSTPLIDREIDRAGIERAFDEAVASNGWLIFYSHDVEAKPSPYGCSPELLRHALEAASKRDMPIVSVADALRRAGA